MENDTQKFCSNCRKDVLGANFDLHYAYCSRNHKLCELCNETIPRSDEGQHFNEVHATVTCEKCHRTMECWECDGPHKDSCSKRLEACQFCELVLPFDHLEEHIAYCGGRTEPCPKCKLLVLIREREYHLEKKCVRRLEPCPFCKSQYPVIELNDHTRVCAANLDSFLSHEKIQSLKTNESFSKKSSTKEMKPCPHCMAYFSSNKYEEHTRHCASMLIRCPVCKEIVPSEEIGDHYKACCDSSQKFDHIQSNSKELNISCDACAPQSSLGKVDPFDNSSSSFRADKKSKNDHHNNGAIESRTQLLGLPSSNSTYEKRSIKSELCQFCGDRFTAEDIGEHSRQCSEYYLTCICQKHVLIADFENHCKNCLGTMKSCKFCNRYFPSSDFEEHIRSCYASTIVCDFCEKVFSGNEFQNHVCSEGRDIKSTMQNGNQKLQHNVSGVLKNPHKNEEPSKYYQRFRQNNQTAENSDHHMALNEYAVDHGTIAKHLATEDLNHGARDKASCPVTYSHVQVTTEHLQSTEDFFLCDICDKEKPMKNLFNRNISSRNGALICEKCVENLKRMDPDFFDNLCSNSRVSSSTKVRSERTEVDGMRDHSNVGSQCELCNSYLPSGNMDEHLNICENRPFECPKCSNLILWCERKIHDRMCTGQPLDQSAFGGSRENEVGCVEKKKGTKKKGGKKKGCRFCHEKPLHDLEAHEQYCGNRLRPCDMCGDYIKFENMQSHCQNRCQKRKGPVRNVSGSVEQSREATEENSLNEYIQAIGKTECRDCQAVLSVLETEKHECPMRIELCLDSGDNIPYGFKEEHVRNDCYSNNTKSTCCGTASRKHNLPVPTAEESALIPCEFCGNKYPLEGLIQHQSGCKPKLFSGQSSEHNDVSPELNEVPHNARHASSDGVIGINVNHGRRNISDQNIPRNSNMEQSERNFQKFQGGNKPVLRDDHPPRQHDSTARSGLTYHHSRCCGGSNGASINASSGKRNINDPVNPNRVDEHFVQSNYQEMKLPELNESGKDHESNFSFKIVGKIRSADQPHMSDSDSPRTLCEMTQNWQPFQEGKSYQNKESNHQAKNVLYENSECITHHSKPGFEKKDSEFQSQPIKMRKRYANKCDNSKMILKLGPPYKAEQVHQFSCEGKEIYRNDKPKNCTESFNRESEYSGKKSGQYHNLTSHFDVKCGNEFAYEENRPFRREEVGSMREPIQQESEDLPCQCLQHSHRSCNEPIFNRADHETKLFSGNPKSQQDIASRRSSCQSWTNIKESGEEVLNNLSDKSNSTSRYPEMRNNGKNLLEKKFPASGTQSPNNSEEAYSLKFQKQRNRHRRREVKAEPDGPVRNTTTGGVAYRKTQHSHI